MRNYLRSPSGVLGACTIATVVVGMSAMSYVMIDAIHDSKVRDEQLKCYVRQLGKPWIGLEESFDAVPGDAAARVRAQEAISAGIRDIKEVGKRCS